MTEYHDKFKSQMEYSLHGSFDTTNSWKQFFFSHDGFRNVENDLTFTLIRRYHCEAGCQICFLNGYWMNENQLAPFIPEQVDEELLCEIFSCFHRVGVVDDLRFLKNKHPHLFEFYKKYSDKLEFHTSDNGLFTQADILKDLKFNRISTVSLSDNLLDKKEGRMVDDVIKILSELNDVSPVEKINFVISKGKPENNPNVMRLLNWLVKVDDTTGIYFHSDITQPVDYLEKSTISETYGYTHPSCYHVETSTNPPTVCTLLTETVHLRGDEFYPDLYTSMPVNALPFYKAITWAADQFLLGLLKEKVRMYTRNKNIMRVHNRYYEYFDWVADNIKTNDNFTFIPSSMLNPLSKIYEHLLNKGWRNTYAGLLRPGATQVIPIAEVKK